MADVVRIKLPSAAEATGAFPGPVDLDLGNLMAYEPRGPPEEELRKDATAACIAHGRDVLQKLVNELFGLPEAEEQGLVQGRLVKLPEPTTRVPREKPLPDKEKAMTRWEKFAKEKGIKKRKRGKMVWDDTQQEWRGRHGYNRVDDPNDIPVIAAKPWEQTGVEDPFTLQKQEKKQRVAAQEGRQVKNLQNAVKQGKKLKPTVTLSSMVPLSGGGGAPLAQKLGKDELRQTSALARVSTASMGKFDRKIDGDKGEKLGGKRRKFMPVVGSGGGAADAERKAMAAVLDKISRKEANKGQVNAEKAAGKFKQEKEREAHARKGAVAAGGGGGGGKPRKGGGGGGKGGGKKR